MERVRITYQCVMCKRLCTDVEAHSRMFNRDVCSCGSQLEIHDVSVGSQMMRRTWKPSDYQIATLVHTDGGDCHGAPVRRGRCVVCGIAPDMQSTEIWGGQ